MCNGHNYTLASVLPNSCHSVITMGGNTEASIVQVIELASSKKENIPEDWGTIDDEDIKF